MLVYQKVFVAKGKKKKKEGREKGRWSLLRINDF